MAQLKSQGFAIGLDSYERVVQLLAASARRGDQPDQIKHKLAALLARTEHEQKRVAELFDAYLLTEFAVPSPIVNPPGDKETWWDWWKENHKTIWFVAGAILFQLLFGYFYIVSNLLGVGAKGDVYALPNARIVWGVERSEVRQFSPFLSDSVVEQVWDWGDGTQDSGRLLQHQYEVAGTYAIRLMVQTERGFRDTFRYVQVFPEELLCSVRMVTLHDSVRTITLSASAPAFSLPFTDSTALGDRDSISQAVKLLQEQLAEAKARDTSLFPQFSWNLGDGTQLTGSSISHTYANDGTYQVRVSYAGGAFQGKQIVLCRDTLSREFVVPNPNSAKDPPPLYPKTIPLPDMSDLLLGSKSMWRLPLLLLLIALMSSALYEWWKARNRKMQLDGSSLKPPVNQPLIVELPHLDLFRSDTFNLAARRLRQRAEGGGEELDLKESIQATLSGGGYADLVYRARSRPAQYLILIDQQSPRDHLARLHEGLVKELDQRDITVVYYFYDKNPGLCWKDRRKPQSQRPIARLASEFGHYRLILIGEGEGLLDPAAPQLAPWTKVFEQWETRAFLSTRPNQAWTFAEELIARQFPFLPAREEGLGQLVDLWQLESRPSPRDLQQQAFEASPPRPDNPHLRHDLRVYLGPDAYHWLCACAVYPQLAYELTLQLGEQTGQPELSLSVLGHLFRLEWFRKGGMPKELRLELLEDLPDELLEKVRNFLGEKLQAKENHAPEGSAAEQERQVTLAIYTYLNSTRNKADVNQLRTALGDVDPNDLADRAVVAQINKIRPNSLVDQFPVSLFRKNLPLFGLKSSVKFLLRSVILLLFGGALAWGLGYRMSQEVAEPPFQISDLVLTSPEDSLRWFHHQAVAAASDSSQVAEWEQVDSLFAQAVALAERKEMDLYDIQVDRFLAQYNEGVRVYQEEVDSAYRWFAPLLSSLFDLPGPGWEIPRAISERDTAHRKDWRSDAAYAAAITVLPSSPSADRPQALSELRDDGRLGIPEAFFLLYQLKADYYQFPGQTAYLLGLPGSQEILTDYLRVLPEADSANPRLLELLSWLGEAAANTYQLSITTGEKDRAQTDESPIELILEGKRGQLVVRLDSSVRQFEQNQTDQWSLPALKDIGTIQKIRLRLGGEGARSGLDDWYLSTLSLTDQKRDTTHSFVVEQWLGDNSGINELELIPGQNQQQNKFRMRGQVRDGGSGSVPLSGVEISWWDQQTTSDQKGGFEAICEPKATNTSDFVTFRLTIPGYVPQQLKIPLADNSQIRVEMISVSEAQRILNNALQLTEEKKFAEALKMVRSLTSFDPFGTLELDARLADIQDQQAAWQASQNQPLDVMYLDLSGGIDQQLLVDKLKELCKPWLAGESQSLIYLSNGTDPLVIRRVDQWKELTTILSSIRPQTPSQAQDLRLLREQLKSVATVQVDREIRVHLFLSSSFYDFAGKNFVNGLRSALGENAPQVSWNIYTAFEVSAARKLSLENMGEAIRYRALIPPLARNLIPATKSVQGGTFMLGVRRAEKDATQTEEPPTEISLSTFAIGQTELANAQFLPFLNERDLEGSLVVSGNDQQVNYLPPPPENSKENAKRVLLIDLACATCIDYFQNISYDANARPGQRFQLVKGRGNFPASGVSWGGADAYCSWLSNRTGEVYRLPSEAEWEYAAAGGSSAYVKGERQQAWAGTDYSKEVSNFAWYNKNSGNRTHPVASLQANGIGLYDMSGNVWEWCEDQWHSNYEGMPSNGSAWLYERYGTNYDRVVRGGSFVDKEAAIRVANRYHFPASRRSNGLGFRVVKEIKVPSKRK